MVFLIVLGSIAVLCIAIYFIEPFIFALLFSGIISLFVRNPPYIANIDEQFPGAKLLRDNFDTIRAELDHILLNKGAIPKFHEVDKLQSIISDKDKVAWRTFVIKGFGKWVDNNCSQVPKTTELLRQLPQVSTAIFSIIDGGKHIPPHIGFFKSVLRYHLAMIIPSDAPVYLIVDGKEYHWKEGQDVLFDDTFKHEVWNKSTGTRTVLFLDVLREKGFPKFFTAINRWMFGVLTSSRKLLKAARNAEVAKDINNN